MCEGAIGVAGGRNPLVDREDRHVVARNRLAIRCANIAHGVWPPLTANVNRRWAAIAAPAWRAACSARRRATGSASGQSSICSATAVTPAAFRMPAELLAHGRQQLARE